MPAKTWDEIVAENKALRARLQKIADTCAELRKLELSGAELSTYFALEKIANGVE
jgi:hypothetical protein